MRREQCVPTKSYLFFAANRAMLRRAWLHPTDSLRQRRPRWFLQAAAARLLLRRPLGARRRLGRCGRAGGRRQGETARQTIPSTLSELQNAGDTRSDGRFVAHRCYSDALSSCAVCATTGCIGSVRGGRGCVLMRALRRRCCCRCCKLHRYVP